MYRLQEAQVSTRRLLLKIHIPALMDILFEKRVQDTNGEFL